MLRCPLDKDGLICMGSDCAWYDKGNKCCAVLAIAVELIHIGDKV